MPWKVAKRGTKWVVVKADTGKVVGTHDSKAEAVKHLRAIYANYRK